MASTDETTTPTTAPDALGPLLRALRRRTPPEAVGLPVRPRARTPGLRREDVARLADVSVTYYTFLEQGRALHPSDDVLAALARAFGLTPTEARHLRTVAGDPDPFGPPPAVDADALAPGLEELVERLDPVPAYVKGHRWDVLCANRGARALFRDWGGSERPNMLRWMVTDPVARDVFVAWAAEAQAMLGRFRHAAARHADDPRVAALVDELHAASAEVRAWWPEHGVASIGGGTKRLRHPAVGELALDHVVLQVPEAPDQHLVSFSAAGGNAERFAAMLAA